MTPHKWFKLAGDAALFATSMFGTIMALQSLDYLIHTRWLNGLACAYLAIVSALAWLKLDQKLP